jgi:hypothetical protein
LIFYEIVFTWFFYFYFFKTFSILFMIFKLLPGTPDRDITWAPGANLTPLIKPLLMVYAMLECADTCFFSFTWCRGKKVFSTQSMYKDIMKEEGTPHRCINWKVKLPLKIKIFLWYFNQRVILTKDNLVKRKWKGWELLFFTQKRAFGIYFLIAEWQGRCGVLLTLLLAFDRQPVWVPCLFLGWKVFVSNLETKFW